MSSDFFSSVLGKLFPPSRDARQVLQSQPPLATALVRSEPEVPAPSPLPVLPPKSSRQAMWYGPGTNITVQGISLESPLVYVGERLKTADGGDDPSLIDPQCSVNQTSSFDLNALTQDCSYRGFSDHQRLAYLQWLCAGRCAVSAPKHFLLVFFYGVERRIVMDSARFPEARAEWSCLMAELKRLLSVHYKNPGAFQRNAMALLNWMELADDPPKIYLDESSRRDTEARPLRMRFALSQAAMDGAPVPAWLALAWARTDPRIVLRKTALKCHELFEWLFIEKYKTAFGKGFRLTPGIVPLEFTYLPASPALQQDKGMVLNFGDMMEVTGPSPSFDALAQLVEDATADLDSYSRVVGVDMGKLRSFDAALSLPVSLWPRSPGVREGLHHCKEKASSGFWVTTLSQALGFFGHDGKPPNRDKLRLWAKALESHGLGTAPDLLSDSRPVALSDPIVFFSLREPTTPQRLPPALALAVLAIDISMTAAMVEPDRSQACVHALALKAVAFEGLSPLDQQRLAAHVCYAYRKTIALGSLKKRLGTLTLAEREQIAALALHCVQGAQEITHGQMKALEKIQAALALDEKKLFMHVHTLSTGGSLPSSSEKPAEFSLDVHRIAQLQRDTDQVVDMLATIFTEDAHVVAAQSVNEDSVMGLSASLSGFARELLSQMQWQRQQVAELAISYGLRIDGALASLNDAAWDAYDMSFTEGDEPIDVNPEILEFFR